MALTFVSAGLRMKAIMLRLVVALISLVLISVTAVAAEDTIRIRADQATLLDIAEVEPNVALALRFLTADLAAGLEKSIAEIVVVALSPSQVRARIVGDAPAAMPGAGPTVRYTVRLTPVRDRFLLTFLPRDARSRGAMIELEPDGESTYRVGRWRAF
jgi:hypothetical protein